MQSELQIIQTLREAQTRASYDANQAYGQRVLTVAGSQAEVARVSVDARYAQSWVVTLAPVTLPGQQTATGLAGLNPQVLSDASAIVEWGMGGSSSWAVIDWTGGQQFSVFGSFVRVIAVLNAWGPNGQPPGVAAETRFAGHVAPGRSVQLPTRTVVYGDVPINTPVERPVPPFARTFNLATSTTSSAVLVATFVRGRIRSAADMIWQMNIILGNQSVLLPGNPVRFPAGTNFINLLSTSAELPNARLVYQLGLS